MKFYQLLLLLLIVSACGSEEPTPTVEVVEPPVEADMHIKLSDEYSLVKNDTMPDVPTYFVPSLDSFIVDVSDYQFDETSVFYRYLESQDEFLQMIGGSWGHINIYYNDSLEISTGRPTDLNGDNKVFAVVPRLDRVKGELPTEFILTFGMYIDNGRGMVDFDEFKVKVVN